MSEAAAAAVDVEAKPKDANVEDKRDQRDNNKSKKRKNKADPFKWAKDRRKRIQETKKSTGAEQSADKETQAEEDGAETAATGHWGGGNPPDVKSERLGPKRKVALLMGFCGTGYQGMQINPGVKTIESELFKALIDVQAVSKDNAEDLKKIGFMRAARTDKGVHAVGQVVNAKLVLNHLDDPVAAINEKLPEQIRIWDVVRTMNGFHSKSNCDGRIYEYILPTYVFEPDTTFHERAATEAAARLARLEQQTGGSNDDDDFVPPDLSQLTVNRDYRITEQQLKDLRTIFARYQGTHKYHNFTVGKSFKDRSVQRYIMSFTVSDPETYSYVNENGERVTVGEWLSLKVKGQSFMLHQIRKMVGLAILLIKTGTPLSLQEELFKDQRVNIPKAPGLGLLLEQCLFDVYNTKKIKDHEDREPLDFEKHMDKIEAFKRKFVYDRIVAEEHQQKWHAWLSLIMQHPHQYAFLTLDGKVPEGYFRMTQARSSMQRSAKANALDAEDDDEAAGSE
ncbi:tRNA pseudouridine synthase 1 [Sorochytrium milnesiophthora]